MSCFEKREREKRRAHGSGSRFNTQIDGHTCNKVRCACRVEQNGIALPCLISACEIDVLPHEIDASTTTPPTLCACDTIFSTSFCSVHHDLLNLSLFMRHDLLNMFVPIFRLSNFFQAIPHEVLHALSSNSHGALQILLSNLSRCSCAQDLD